MLYNISTDLMPQNLKIFDLSASKSCSSIPSLFSVLAHVINCSVHSSVSLLSLAKQNDCTLFQNGWCICILCRFFPNDRHLWSSCILPQCLQPCWGLFLYFFGLCLLLSFWSVFFNMLNSYFLW